MSSSQNSEMTHSMRHEVKSFDKYGMVFQYGIAIETSPEWEPKFTTPKSGAPTTIEWVETGNTHENSYVQYVRISDDGLCKEGNFIEVYSTADGPIMGILLERREDGIVLLDPCIVYFDGKSGGISLYPIFNVGRRLQLKHTAIRSVQAPAEVLLAAYPGFLINNRMSKHQLKLKVPMSVTPELTNDAS